MSQRIARWSTKLPAVDHQRCGTATVWARSAATPTSVGMVVTQPEKPGWPTRSPCAMTASLSVARTASRPSPCWGNGASSCGRHTERNAAGSVPSKRRNCSSEGSTRSMASVRSWLEAASCRLSIAGRIGRARAARTGCPAGLSGRAATRCLSAIRSLARTGRPPPACRARPPRSVPAEACPYRPRWSCPTATSGRCRC